MSMINCPECTVQVSNNAVACPQCGEPIAGAKQDKAAGAALTTTQATSKKLKFHIIVSSIVFWAGVAGVVWLSDTNSPALFAISSMGVPVGLIWYVVTKFRIWWHHK